MILEESIKKIKTLESTNEKNRTLCFGVNEIKVCEFNKGSVKLQFYPESPMSYPRWKGSSN